ncbi:hypothetical protein ABIB40_001720 [Pedobacter sp. UYP30]|uniref:DUF3347 domain-containing protein n=1 Tax=Pedobacter sp. UYP30 TaxID=1756400 RepID=UPI003391F2E1
MKRTILTLSLAASILAACNNGNTKTTDVSSKPTTETMSASTPEPNQNPLIADYLSIKDALVKDDSKTAAEAGKTLAETLKAYDASGLNTAQKKTFDDIKPDALENAEHISENADKIAHQREHFILLSEDMYDLVKSLGTKQTLYKDFCPMANDKKGAFWISSIKNIQNPYMGQKMNTCGSVKETINQ